MDLYDVLGVDQHATPSQIKKAYRERAQECHPDKGGDEESFQRVNEAYEILSDEKKRSIYDRSGSVEASKQWDEEIRRMMGALFLQIVLNGRTGNIIKDAISAVSAQRNQFVSRKAQAESDIKKIERALPTVRRKDGERSIFNDVLQTQLAVYREDIRSCDSQYQLFSDMISEFEKYEEDKPACEDDDNSLHAMMRRYKFSV